MARFRPLCFARASLAAPLLALTPAALAHAMPGMTAPAARAVAEPAAVRVTDAFVQATPPGVPDGSAYLTLVNTSGAPLKLLGGQIDLAASVVPMRQRRDAAGVSGMQAAPFMLVPARGQLALRPGGDHLMLMKLKRAPKAGETVTLTLRFENRAPLALKLPVRRL